MGGEVVSHFYRRIDYKSQRINQNAAEDEILLLWSLKGYEKAGSYPFQPAADFTLSFFHTLFHPKCVLSEANVRGSFQNQTSSCNSYSNQTS